jgi:hypothetical protein
MKMTTFKFTACAVLAVVVSADTTLMAAANQPTVPNNTASAATSTTTLVAPVADTADTPADAVVATPPALPANSDAPGSLLVAGTSSRAYGNLQNDAHKDEIIQWAQNFAQEHKELIADGMAVVQKLQAEATALNTDAGNGSSSTAAVREQMRERAQKLRGAVKEQVQQYFADPEHEQQLDAIRGEVQALVAKHIPDVKAWVAEHRVDVLAYLEKVTEGVEAGSIPRAYGCDITEPACITQPAAQEYMKVHSAEVNADMAKFEAARDAFVQAHKQQLLKVLGAVTKMVETGEYQLPDGAKDALLSKWKGMQEDTDADTDADTKASYTQRALAAGAAAGSIPAGTYKGVGEKCVGFSTFFGCGGIKVTVDTDAVVHADNTVDVKVSTTGAPQPVDLDCENEPYTLEAGRVVLTNYPRTAASDPQNTCIVDGLPKTASLKSLTYDAAGSKVVMKVENESPIGVIDLTVDAKCGDCAAATSRRLM